jgi:hypothetical protein
VYVCSGFFSVEYVPSPKFHFHETGDPALLSVNKTFNGATPLLGFTLNEARGVDFTESLSLISTPKSPLIVNDSPYAINVNGVSKFTFPLFRGFLESYFDVHLITSNIHLVVSITVSPIWFCRIRSLRIHSR